VKPRGRRRRLRGWWPRWSGQPRRWLHTALATPLPLPMACPAPPCLFTNSTAPSLIGVIDVVIVLSRARSPLTSVGQGRTQRSKGCRGGHHNQSPLHSTTPCGSNDEDSLPTLEIHLHIAIEVVCHLKIVQKMKLLSFE
jgi:hypothetical protein